jgi:hypothetical protein
LLPWLPVGKASILVVVIFIVFTSEYYMTKDYANEIEFLSLHCPVIGLNV